MFLIPWGHVDNHDHIWAFVTSMGSHGLNARFWLVNKIFAALLLVRTYRGLFHYFEDVDDCLYAFHQLFEQILDRHAPVKKVKIRSRPNPFITPEIRELMRTRDKWKKLAHRSNDPLAWAGFRNYKREVKREIRIAEREFVRDQIANNQNNSSGNSWKTIRSILPRK